MVTKAGLRPLDMRTLRRLPQLRRVLAWYEGGMPVQEIAIAERLSCGSVYYALAQARRCRRLGKL